MWDITFNGQTGWENHMAVVRRPDIPSPIRRYRTVTIPGRDGTLYIDEGVIEDIEINVEMNFISKPDEWFAHFRQAKKWLKGSGKLNVSDDQKFFYKVKKVDIATAERVCYEIGKFTVTFTCEGWNYVEGGDRYHAIAEVLYNPCEVSCPIYEITGEGMCTLTVNGKNMSANIGQKITIDTGLMIAYRDDETQNAKVTGDYKDLYLQEGYNTISVSENFTVRVAPNWRVL